MNDSHALHANNSVNGRLVRADSLDQADGSSDRTPSTIIIYIKEIMMHAHGHTTVWKTHIGIGRSGDMKGWYQQLRDWWTAHKAKRLEARCTSLNACWDATREVYRPRRADAALEMAMAQGALSMATQPYSLIQ
jgi:hypothetical protein